MIFRMIILSVVFFSCTTTKSKREGIDSLEGVWKSKETDNSRYLLISSNNNLSGTIRHIPMREVDLDSMIFPLNDSPIIYNMKCDKEKCILLINNMGDKDSAYYFFNEGLLIYNKIDFVKLDSTPKRN